MSLLKKAVQLNIAGTIAQILDDCNARIKVSSVMIQSSKKDLEQAIKERDCTIRDCLLENHNYIIGLDDKVVYMDQIGKILVYETKDSNNEGHVSHST